MNRRSFLASILAAGVAPAIVRADALMRIVPREVAVLTDPAFAGVVQLAHFEGPRVFTFTPARPRYFALGDIISFNGVSAKVTSLTTTRLPFQCKVEAIETRTAEPPIFLFNDELILRSD